MLAATFWNIAAMFQNNPYCGKTPADTQYHLDQSQTMSIFRLLTKVALQKTLAMAKSSL